MFKYQAKYDYRVIGVVYACNELQATKEIVRKYGEVVPFDERNIDRFEIYKVA